MAKGELEITVNLEFILLGGPWRTHSAALNLTCSSVPRKYKRYPVSSLGILYRYNKMEERKCIHIASGPNFVGVRGEPELSRRPRLGKRKIKDDRRAVLQGVGEEGAGRDKMLRE